MVTELGNLRETEELLNDTSGIVQVCAAVQWFRALLNLEEPKDSIEQIAAKMGKLLACGAALSARPHNSYLCRDGVD